ncbi:MAG: hypothetical protein ABL921_27755 [Pirellula sp.]
MRFLLTSIVLVWTISDLHAQDRIIKELIPELQPFAWMIGKWEPDEVSTTSSKLKRWVWFNGGNLRNGDSDLKMLTPIDVRKSEDGQKLVTSYTYSTMGRETHVNEIISWDAKTRKVNWNCKFDWVKGAMKETGDTEAFLEPRENAWVAQTSQTNIRFVVPQYSLFERTLYTPESFTITAVVKNDKFSSANLKPELRPLAWMVGDWRSSKVPSTENGFYSYILAADGMQVRPSADGSRLQIRYYYCIQYGGLWACEGDVVEIVSWDADKKSFRVDTSIEIFSSFRRHENSIREERVYFLIPVDENNKQSLEAESAANAVHIQRTAQGLRRTGFADGHGDSATSHPELGQLLKVDFSKIN